MALSLCIVVSVGGRHSQCSGPSPTLGSLGPSHQWRHKSRVSLRGALCAHGVSGTPHGEVRNTAPENLLNLFTFYKSGNDGIISIFLGSTNRSLCIQCDLVVFLT